MIKVYKAYYIETVMAKKANKKKQDKFIKKKQFYLSVLCKPKNFS